LIELGGSLVCPDGNHRELLRVDKFFEKIRDDILDALNRYNDFISKIEDIFKLINETNLGILSLKELKSSKFVEYKQTLLKIISEIDGLVKRNIMLIDNLFRRYSDHISQIFKNANLKEFHLSQAYGKSLVSQIDFGFDKVEEFSNKLSNLLNNIGKVINNMSKLPQKIMYQINDDEYIIEFTSIGAEKKKFLVLTNKRLFIFKNVKKIKTIFLKEISDINTERKLLFKGIVINLINDGKIKIQCEAYSCLEILQKINETRNHGFFVDESDVDLNKSVQNIMAQCESLKNKIEDLKIKIKDLMDTHTAKFMGRFYMSNSSKSEIFNHTPVPSHQNANCCGNQAVIKLKNILKEITEWKRALINRFENGKIPPSKFYETYHKIVQSEEKIRELLQRFESQDIF